MTHRIQMVHKAFDPGIPREYAEYYILHLLEAGARSNMKWLQLFPDTPLLYDSGVRYVPEDGTEEWPDIPTVLAAGVGDCEDLVMYRVAELRVRYHVRCRPFIRWRQNPNGHRLYHCLVAIRRANGSQRIEDPSRRLGMNGEG
jgi:hypothetical protein